MDLKWINGNLIAAATYPVLKNEDELLPSRLREGKWTAGKMDKSETRDSIQYAALPFHEAGTPRVMLLTSRETGRWVIPKGWPMPGRKPCQVAKREAYEEAGLIGKMVSKQPVGSYHYTKVLSPQQQVVCEVLVFLFRVECQLEDWPEQSRCETRWFEPREAAAFVDEGGLCEIIRLSFNIG
jgi:8-oxo-dGTP pyrophosphatase MutT (NUDIX family)